MRYSLTGRNWASGGSGFIGRGTSPKALPMLTISRLHTLPFHLYLCLEHLAAERDGTTDAPAIIDHPKNPT